MPFPRKRGDSLFAAWFLCAALAPIATRAWALTKQEEFGKTRDESNAVVVSIYHSNDVHGWIMPRHAGGSLNAADPGRMIGGMGAYANWVRADKGPKLVVDAGDWFQGTPEGMMSQGRAMVDAFNALGLDAIEVGNHDFDLGQDQLARIAGKLKAPVLCANVYEEKTGKRPRYCRANLIKKVAGVRIGIFGLITAMRRNYIERNIEGLRLRREVEEARDQVAELQRRGATVIIAITHVGLEDPPRLVFEGEKLIASSVPGIDVIVGGHTHVRLDTPYREPVNGTLIVDTGLFLSHGGRVKLTIDRKTGKVEQSDGILQPLWTDVFGEAKDEAKIVARYHDQVGKSLDLVIGRAAATLTRENYAESALGDWTTDCLREAAGARLAFENSPSLRSDLPEGDVTLRKMYEIMPFDNYIATTTLSGAQIRQALEYAVGGATNILQVSGLSFHYLPDGPPGKRVTEIAVEGKPMDDGARYVVGTNDYLLRGGDGYPSFHAGQGSFVTSRLVRDAFADCVRMQSPVGAPKRGRIFRD